MFGFVFGALCLMGLASVIRRGRYGRHSRYGYGRYAYDGGCGDRGYSNRRSRRSRRGGDPSARRSGVHVAMTEIFKRRLDVDEDQEGIIDHALKDLLASVSTLKEALKASREDVAAAFADDKVDEASLDVVFAHHDDELKSARRQVVSAMKQIHAVLTPEQRTQATSWLSGELKGAW